MTAPAIYDSVVRHARKRDLDYSFSHPTYMWLVDLDEMPRLPFWLRPFAGFRSGDHFGDPERSIRCNVDTFLAERGVDLDGGRVLMLANARVLGYVFNPISVYWCHRADGELACVIAEVHNTYGGRHAYLLFPDPAGRASTAKEFYVSPFLTVDGDYSMLLREPDERLAVAVTLHQQGAPALVATLAGTRRPAGPAQVLRTVLRRPFVTQRTSFLIRLHGVALWLRRLPVVPRPQSPPTPQPPGPRRHVQEGVTR